MTELWQLYDESGEPIAGQGASKDDIYKGALHGAVHVWVWRLLNDQVELLLQHRAPQKLTWPNTWGESVGGHIDLSESPETAALREATEEIGVNIKFKDLVLITKRKDYLVAPNGAIENEFRWVYAYQLQVEIELELEENKVDDAKWRSLGKVKQDLADKKIQKQYLPQGATYYHEVFAAIEKLATQMLK